MPLDFSAMQLIFENDSPILSDMLSVFADDSEEKVTLQQEHYIINRKNISSTYFWFHVRYGKELPYTQTVINTANDEEELNPRSKEQIEPDQQLFGLYSFNDKVFYLSNFRKKTFFELYLSSKLNKSVVIKSFLKTPEEFIKSIKSIEKIKLVTKKTLFSMDGGVVSISPEHKDIFGLGVPEEFSIEAEFKHAKLTDKFIQNVKNMANWTKTSEAESLVCIGRDENDLETIFNVDSFRQKISLLIEKDTYGMYDSEAVCSLIQLKMEGK